MLTIRVCSNHDIHIIGEITRTALREAYPDSFFETIGNYWPEGFLVAESGGQIVGFVMGIISGVKQARILMLAVQEPYRRNGIASTLIRSFKSSCLMKGLDSIILEVRISNTPAINLYGKFGFKLTSTLRGYYRDGEDGYRMELVLQS